MTFKDTLDNCDAKIAWLGGLEAVQPYIPYSAKHIREHLDKYGNLDMTDINAWRAGAGFTPNNIRNGYGLAELLVSRHITEFSCMECIDILKHAAVKLAEQPLKDYIITIAIDGRLDIPVRACAPAEAVLRAEDIFKAFDLNGIECVKHAILYAEDEDGVRTDF